jgi:DNA-binding Lrp family transcriptional regulator
MELDSIDTAIVGMLGKNGRMSNREVARLLNVSEGMVRQRLKKLIDGDAVRLGLVTDIEAASFLSTVIVRLNTVPARARSVATKLAALDCCTFVSLTFGRFDVIAIIVGKSRAEIVSVVDQQIASSPDIRSIDIVEPVKAVKHRYDLVYLKQSHNRRKIPGAMSPS